MPFYLRLAIWYLATTGNCWEHVSSSKLQSILEKQDDALVAFVAATTEISKALEPEWKIAKSKKDSNLFVSIDCTIEHKFCAEQDVASFPAIRFFQGPEKWTRYRGERKAAPMKAFVERARRPIVSTLTYQNVTSFHSVDDAVFIAYIPTKGDYTDLYGYFTNLAVQYHHSYSFGILADEGLEIPQVTCYLPDEDEPRGLGQPYNPSRLELFVRGMTEPPVGQLTVRNELKYLKSGKSLVYIFAQTDKERSAFRAELKQLATKFQEYLSFLTVDAVQYNHMLSQLDLDPKRLPAAAVYNPGVGQVFPFDQSMEITPEVIDEFVMDIVQGKISPSGAGRGAGGQREGHDEL